jgi:phosphohistidine phosphatase
MKTLILIRHAKSSWDHIGITDRERPLNAEGHLTATKMSTFLAQKLGQVDAIVSSPAVRAYSTAKYFAKAFNIHPDNIEIRREIYDAMPDDIIELVRTLDDNDHKVLVFGHNPTFTYLAGSMSTDFIDNVPTCGIAIYNCKIDKWADFNTTNSELYQLIRPKTI